MDSMREMNVSKLQFLEKKLLSTFCSDRGWEYQKCVELGAYITTPKNDNDHPFGGDFLPLE